jgi:hypothetical protein
MVQSAHGEERSPTVEKKRRKTERKCTEDQRERERERNVKQSTVIERGCVCVEERERERKEERRKNSEETNKKQ